MNATPAQALVPAAARTPDSYPQRLDLARRATLLLGFDASTYRTASFLDDRVVGPGMVGAWVANAQLDEATRQVAAPRPMHLLLHTGHVGSTLLSRLLDDLGGTLSLREPLPLRTLAEAHDGLEGGDSLVSPDEFAQLGAMFLRLWSRGYPDTARCVLKATSSAGRLAPWLMARQAGINAVYLNLAAEPFLATLLAGANSRDDLRGHGPERHRRLAAAGATGLAALHSLSPGELAAHAWLAESLTRHRLATQFPGRVLLLDFDALLADVPGTVGAVARHFSVAATGEQLQALAHSPTLQRYSKAPEHSYGPQLRAELLKQSRREHAGQIAAGLRWIERMASANSELAAVVGTAGA